VPHYVPLPNSTCTTVLDSVLSQSAGVCVLLLLTRSHACLLGRNHDSESFKASEVVEGQLHLKPRAGDPATDEFTSIIGGCDPCGDTVVPSAGRVTVGKLTVSGGRTAQLPTTFPRQRPEHLLTPATADVGLEIQHQVDVLCVLSVQGMTVEGLRRHVSINTTVQLRSRGLGIPCHHKCLGEIHVRGAV
jgi:hypothetical protein